MEDLQTRKKTEYGPIATVKVSFRGQAVSLWKKKLQCSVTKEKSPVQCLRLNLLHKEIRDFPCDKGTDDR